MILIEISYFVVYLLLVMAFYALTKKGKTRWAEIRSRKCPFENLFVFLILTTGITFALSIACIILINSSSLLFDDWFFNLYIVLPFFSGFIGFFFLFYAPSDSIECKDRTEASGRPAEKRPWYFYLILLILFPVLPARYVCTGYDSAKFMLGGFPIVLAISSLAVDILLIVSNKRHNIGIHDMWSKAGIIYAFIVAIAYPIMHSACFMGEFSTNFEEKLLYIDPTNWLFVYFFLAFVVYGSAYFAIGFIIDRIAGYQVQEDVYVKNWRPLDYDSSTGTSSYTEPQRPYRSILDAPEISDDYYGKHGEFDLNDEARRISEDIQQFHRSHPDADLSDHYYWEDILDAETDGYLDDE